MQEKGAFHTDASPISIGCKIAGKISEMTWKKKKNKRENEGGNKDERTGKLWGTGCRRRHCICCSEEQLFYWWLQSGVQIVFGKPVITGLLGVAGVLVLIDNGDARFRAGQGFPRQDSRG